MRKAWLPPVLIFIGILVQLTVLDGLRLPGGGVPDLVLVLVAALALAQGPLAGLVIGFAAGLCLDLAPPGSALIGQYALVFCLVGWVAGCAMIWSALFAVGNILYGRYGYAVALSLIFGVSALVVMRVVHRLWNQESI